jgi:diaminohydroxyphosphoribosylaminopyrimidine deaminase/5-amino-6-(5-phosphoribosylamino)uracil reductase
MKDEEYMKKAIALAKRGYPSPNPMVGAVAVKDGRIVGKGYHAKAGLPHAEINALKGAGDKARGASLYVSLEPCCHQGRTPPCTNSIINSGISKVVIGCIDPNPLVRGKGIEILKNKGIEVKVGVLEAQCKKLNETYFKHITKREPFVLLKMAMSLDGRIADRYGNSKYLVSEKSLKLVHKLRKRYDAVLVGANTVRMDDPQLDVRHVENREGRDPYKVVVTTRLSNLPKRVKLFKKEKVVIACCAKDLDFGGVDILQFPGKKVPIRGLMKTLARKGITSIMIEGGGEVAWRALKEKVVDKIFFFLSPKILGGGKSVVNGKGFPLKDCIKISYEKIYKLDKDLIIEAVPIY